MSRLSNYRESVLQTGYDFVGARVLQTAFELDLFEKVGSGSKTASALAQELNAHPESLELFLNALVSLGFLAADGHAYQNTKFGGEIFLKGEPLYVGDMVALQAKMSGAWLGLKESVLKGQPVEEPEFFKSDEASAGFARAMHNTAMGHAEYLAKKLALGSAKKLLDLGGGPGTFTIHFLKANPGLEATVFDLPATLKTTRQFVEEARLADRVRYQAGDFNVDGIEGTFDACFLSHIIHSQDAEKNKELFRQIFAHLNAGGKLVVQDFFLNADKQSPRFSALFALTMLIYTDSGRTYTFDEVEAWMRKTGFAQVKRPNLRLPRSISLVIGERG